MPRGGRGLTWLAAWERRPGVGEIRRFLDDLSRDAYNMAREVGVRIDRDRAGGGPGRAVHRAVALPAKPPGQVSEKDSMHCPLVVLGGGPGGYAAAFLAADLGMPVTLVEREERLGGTCLLRGCIPSKALLHVGRVLSESREMEEWGVHFSRPSIDVGKLRARKDKVISTLTGGLAQLAKRRNVTIVHGNARFVDSSTLEVAPATPGGASQRSRALPSLATRRDPCAVRPHPSRG